jgi:hypothetical protein
VDTEVEHADILLAYADAIYASDSGDLERTREQVRSRMGSGATIEAAATAANFSMLDRIANAVGIQIESMAIEQTEDFRGKLGINQYVSAANTLGNL